MADGKLAVVAAGGTGGHMFPAEALARELTSRGWRVVLATDARGEQYAQHFPAQERLALEAATFSAKDPIKAVTGAWKLWAGVRQAKAAFARLKPAVIVGFGGYPSLPAMLAAGVTPTVIHEQNAVLGRSNRLLSRRVTAVACAFPTLQRADPKVKAAAHVVGNPVRAEIRALYDQPYAAFGIGTINVLVTGGSQGARLLSDVTPEAIAMLPEDLRLRLTVQQQTRPESAEAARATYAEAGVGAEVAPFFRDMAGRLGQAHLVIGRAGASTVSELAVAGRPSILIPLAIAADDHQSANARLLSDPGAAVVLQEETLTAERLADTIRAILTDSEGLARRAAAAHAVATPHAAQTFADLVEATATA